MAKRHTSSDENVQRHVNRLVEAARTRGLYAEVVTMNRVSLHEPTRSEELAETITLRPDETGLLRWYWEWNLPVGDADDPYTVVGKVERVIYLRRRIIARAAQKARSTAPSQSRTRVASLAIGDRGGVSRATRADDPDSVA